MMSEEKLKNALWKFGFQLHSMDNNEKKSTNNLSSFEFQCGHWKLHYEIALFWKLVNLIKKGIHCISFTIFQGPLVYWPGLY